MSFINFDPFKALSNKTGALPQFEIGRNFLFPEKIGKGDYEVSSKFPASSKLASAGNNLVHTTSATLAPYDDSRQPELNID